MTTADTGIVVGTYNNAAHVDATIASIRAQAHAGWQAVVVDNGSTDATVARLRELVGADPRFTLHLKTNEGPSAGRNAGVRLLPAALEFVHFLDGDDLLHPAFLGCLTAHLRRHPPVGLVGCQFDVVDAAGRTVGPGHRSRIAPSAWGLPWPLRDDQIDTPFETFFCATGQGPFAVFRRSVLDRTTGYEADFWSHEDSDIFCQMALLAPVHYLPERLYRKRVHGNNLTGSPRADYGKFRRKWDRMVSADPQVDRRLEAALRYYYGRHAPLRHLKVGAKAALEFLRSADPRKLAWSLRCLGNGLDDLLLRRELARRLQMRQGAGSAVTAP